MYITKLPVVVVSPLPCRDRGDGDFRTTFANAEEQTADGEGSDWETVNLEKEEGNEGEEEEGEEEEGGYSDADRSQVHPGESTTKTYHPLLNGEHLKIVIIIHCAY